jgi:pyruvate/2-oxoglutarate dehydrogenase complex dihydrolipoamide acyltransferase (E2) component
VVDITLPDEAWADVEEGTEALLDEWLVAVGDRVEQGQVIANVVLVKATHEITAPAAGIVESIEVAAEKNFQRGQVLARIKTG